ncbi:hypothetical protein LDENG_00293350 [Lucifuga dentata]|nr:hypothetical protein LDENG_00293350 [Lucifuga dentata]
MASSYICDKLTSYEPAHSLRSSGSNLLTITKSNLKTKGSLRSSGSNLLTITKSNLKTKGDRAFAVRVPKLWNDLPEDLRLAKSVPTFKSQLKTNFYRLAFM